MKFTFNYFKFLLFENLNKKYSTVYLLVGLPGSGKSEWCKREHPELPVVSRDILRNKLGYISSIDKKTILDTSKEYAITIEERKRIFRYCKYGQDFIIDDMNIVRRYRKNLIQFLHDLGAYVIGVRFSTDLKTCIVRRKNQIPPNIMLNIAHKFTPLSNEEVDEIIDEAIE